MATIDSLDIQIGSSAKLANQAIDSLIKNLDRLSKSLNIDTSKLSNIGKVLNFSGIEKTAKSVESQMQKISKSAAKVAKDFENKFKDISVKVDFSRPEAELKKFQKQAQTAENALSRIMASSSADKQTAGIEKWSISLAQANNAIKILKSHMDGLQTAQPQFDFKMAGAESSIKFLVEYKKQLMDLKNDIKSMSDVYGGLQNIPKGGLDTPIQNLKQSIEKLKQSYPQATNVISAFEQELQKLQTISAGLTKEPTKINFDESSIDRINEKITELKNKFKKVGSDFKFQGNFEQLNIEIEKVYSKLSELRTKEQEMISAGKVDTSAFEQLQESLARIGNKFGIMQDLRDRTESFNQSLQQLRVPEIREENLTKLQNSLRKTEEDVEKLRIKLANQISMGNIIPNIDDSGFRKLTEQIALSEKQAEALRAKIQELGGDTNKTSSATNTLGKNIKKLSSSMNGFTKSAGKAVSGLKSFTRQLLSGMGIYLGVYGAVKGLKKSIESSMDYIEILNYFDAAFGQVAENADLSAFEEMGYDSAQAYYNSFAQRAEELTAKMSGFTVGEGGLLESTGAVSLGLDPGQLMNYQAMFGQMASSMGVASETSLDLSQALTEIAADLASVKNLNFEDVWNDMASGLAGMSRTLDKYGVNIRNVNLQQKLNELGIDANISALNQNDKALLRTIVLLDSTKYAWGDLADTINQPSNQLRMIQANFQNLSRTIGNLFLPIVKTVLPYINALVIAVQRLFAWLGNLIGIDISDISTSIGSTDISGFLDQTDDLSDSLGGVANNAKKAKAGLRAFDELKTISMPEETNAGTGLGGIGGGLLDAAFQDAFSEYQKTWDKAFGKLENRAQELADKIEKAFEPVKKIIQDFAIGDFFQAGKDTSTLVVSIFDFFADAIDRVDWEQIGHDIGEFLEGIEWTEILKSVGNLIWEALEAAVETWEGMFDAAPIETAIITAIMGLKFTGLGTKWFSTLSSKMSASIAGKSIGLIPTIAIAAATWKISFDVGKEIGKILFPESAEWYDNFHWFGEGGFFDVSIEEYWNGLIEWAKDSNSQLGILIKLKEKLEESGFKISGWTNFSTGVIGSLNKIKDWDGFSEWFKVSVSPWFTKERWGALGENIKSGLESKSKNFFSWWKDKGVPEWFTVSVSPIFSYGRWSELGENIKSALSEKWKNFTSWWNEGGAQKWFEISVSPIFSASKWNFSGIADGLSQAWENAVAAIKGIWNKFVEWINEKLDFSWSPVSVMGKEIVPGGNIKLGKVGKFPQYATGGFPEDGLFYANHNELIGEFTNGKTVVINNEQIIQGLADAIYPAVYNAVSAAMKNDARNQEVKVVIESNNSELFRVIQDEANKFTTRTQKPAFNI